jgi:alkylhydroperoxidase/carboxymuconolactone decarboxylase family protein YurZ
MRQHSLIDANSHLIAYVGFPGGLTALEIANEVIGSRK